MTRLGVTVGAFDTRDETLKVGKLQAPFNSVIATGAGVAFKALPAREVE